MGNDTCCDCSALPYAYVGGRCTRGCGKTGLLGQTSYDTMGECCVDRFGTSNCRQNDECPNGRKHPDRQYRSHRTADHGSQRRENIEERPPRFVWLVGATVWMFLLVGLDVFHVFQWSIPARCCLTLLVCRGSISVLNKNINIMH